MAPCERLADAMLQLWEKFDQAYQDDSTLFMRKCWSEDTTGLLQLAGITSAQMHSIDSLARVAATRLEETGYDFDTTAVCVPCTQGTLSDLGDNIRAIRRTIDRIQAVDPGVASQLDFACFAPIDPCMNNCNYMNERAPEHNLVMSWCLVTCWFPEMLQYADYVYNGLTTN